MPPPNLKTTLSLTLIYFLLPLMALMSLTMLALRRIPDSAQTKNQRLIPVYNTSPFSQIIQPKNNGLNTVYIYLKNGRLLNTDPFTFTLSDSDGRVLRKIELNGRNIGDGDNVRFQFDPIWNSSGNSYVITLRAPYTSFDAPKIEVGASLEDPGQLAHELFYRPENPKAVLLESLSFLAERTARVPYLSVCAMAGLGSYTLLRKFVLSGR